MHHRAVRVGPVVGRAADSEQQSGCHRSGQERDTVGENNVHGERVPCAGGSMESGRCDASSCLD